MEINQNIIKTSFGELQILLKSGVKPQVEYLKFVKNGRSHKHHEFESFFVLAGEGKIYSGKNVFNVKSGDLVTTPPNASHWMEPAEGQVLEGLLWYHAQKVNFIS